MPEMPTKTEPPAGPTPHRRAAGRPSTALVLRRVAGGLILMLVLGLATCHGLWSTAMAGEAGPLAAGNDIRAPG
jgi:hypothetical protein